MTPQEITIEKIKKLLRMKRGGTDAEVQTALGLAAELARKHGLDLANINPDEDATERTISHIDALRSSRLQWECKYAAMIAQCFFNVTILFRDIAVRKNGLWRRTIEYSITFIGTRTDTQIALYIYHFLVGRFRRSWSQSSKRIRNRQSFMYGMYIGLCHNLVRSRPTMPDSDPGSALVLRETQRRNDYLDRTFPGAKNAKTTPDSTAMAAASAGYSEGRNTHIAPAINAPPTTPLQLAS